MLAQYTNCSFEQLVKTNFDLNAVQCSPLITLRVLESYLNDPKVLNFINFNHFIFYQAVRETYMTFGDPI